MNETLKQLNSRQSIRRFIDREISQEAKDLILEATFNAPSAGCMQLYSIIDIEDIDLKKQIAKLCDNQDFINDAKWILIYIADYQKWYDAFSNEGLNPRAISHGDLLLAMEDALIAAQNSVTAAYSLGIDSCYIGDIMENGEKIVELLKLPKHTYPCTMLVFGYRDEKHQGIKPQRVDKKYIVYKNKYKQLNKDELKDMLKHKAENKDYHDFMQAFVNRKHNSDFSIEMQRSAKFYIDRFVQKDK